MSKEKPDNLTFAFEDEARKHGYELIIGIDEAGRGPLAGPVVASAVALKTRHFNSKIRDSKKVTPRQRLKAFEEIYDNAYVGVGIISEAVIDEMNILQATYFAMANAVRQLLWGLPETEYSAATSDSGKNLLLLIDGNSFKSDLEYPWKAIINGDAKCFSIACASIIAKVTRDRILEHYDKVFPHYGFKKHKGYPTKSHKEAIREHGYCLIHRRSFSIR